MSAEASRSWATSGFSTRFRPQIAYIWPHDMEAHINSTFFQRPYGLARAFRVRFLTNSNSAVPQEIRRQVLVCRAPAAPRWFQRACFFLWCMWHLWHFRRTVAAAYAPGGTTVVLGWLAQRLLGMVWVVELWDHLKLESNYARQNGRSLRSFYYRLRSRMFALLIRSADLVICTGNAGMVAQLGVPSGRLVVSPNGVDTELCDNRMQREESTVLRAIYVGWVGRSRGADLMFDAMAILKEHGAPVVLTLVGPWNPPDSDWIEKSCRALRGHVVSAGWVPLRTVIDMLGRSDIGLFPFPPYEELEYIYPIKVYEYMACGVVPISTNLTGVRDIVEHGANGFLLKSGSAQELADLLRDLASTPSVLRPMRGAARRRAESFDWREINRRVNQRIAACLDDRAFAARNADKSEFSLDSSQGDPWDQAERTAAPRRLT
jgi:glycosyltransferase involved in cell wall biosynthesis